MAGELFVVGLSWRTAPVAVREKLAFPDDEGIELLRLLCAHPDVAEAMLISTCNRVEIFGVARTSAASAAAAARGVLLANRDLGGLLADALFQSERTEAVRHVFKVASALDSLVLGEAQILGQVKDAYARAVTVGTAGAILRRCLERGFGVAKRVRSETSIGRGAANVSSVAVELAAHVFGDLRGKSVLVIGAGKMSALAARHLREAGAGNLVVTNRSFERAVALAHNIGASAARWDQLETLLSAADVVISSTGAREPVLTEPLFRRVSRARKWKPIMVIDIAVPRDADPRISDFDGVYLFDIDDLERVVAANLAERAKAAAEAHAVVDVEVAQFEQWLRSQRVVPTIRALREHFTRVADAEVQKTLEQLARRDHSAEQRNDAIRRLGQLIVSKLLHHPQTVLKGSPPQLLEPRVEAACALFALPVEQGDLNQELQPEMDERSDDPLEDIAIPTRRAT